MKIIDQEHTIASVDALKPHPRNPRKGDVDAIQESIAENGFYGTVIAQRSTGHILAGNHTLQAAIASGAREVPVTYLDVDDEAALRILLADNRTSDGSKYDDGMLADILQGLLDETGSITGTGYDTSELEKLLGRSDDDNEPGTGTPPATPKSKRGEVYQLGVHRLMCGDSTDDADVAALMQDDRAQLVNTDPPYGVSYQGEGFEVIENDDKRDDDLLKILTPALRLAAKYSVDTAAFYIWHASSTRKDFEWAMDAAGLEEKQYIIWAKDSFLLGRSDYHWQHEPCFYARKSGQQPAYYGDRTNSTVWRFAARRATGERSIAIANGVRISDGEGSELYIQNRAPKSKKARLTRLRQGEVLLLVPAAEGGSDLWEVRLDADKYQHPTQKPVALAAHAIQNSSSRGDIVLDLFGGGGFTLLAAESTGRQARVMELDPAYCDVIRRRFAEFADKPELAP